jgi:hypothetical protein
VVNTSGGTLRLAYDGQVTGKLLATAALVDAALEGLSGIGVRNLTTTGANGTFAITFTGEKAITNMKQVFGDVAMAYCGSPNQFTVP